MQKLLVADEELVIFLKKMHLSEPDPITGNTRSLSVMKI